jgi:hypothetical protein
MHDAWWQARHHLVRVREKESKSGTTGLISDLSVMTWTNEAIGANAENVVKKAMSLLHSWLIPAKGAGSLDLAMVRERIQVTRGVV